MNIYNFTNYHAFLNSFLKSLPKQGHGKLRQWAYALDVSTTLLSQIMKGKKSLSLELADALAQEMGLSKNETEYFFLLVQLERAGTVRLKNYFKQKVSEAQEASRQLKNRIQNVQGLSNEIKAQYYSSWAYSGVRNLLPCREIKTLDEVSERLKLPRAFVSEIAQFLLQAGLIIENGKRWDSGVNSTYLPPDSALISKHHQNWRMRAMQKMDIPLSEDLFYTSPMSLSEDMSRKLRKYLVDVIEEFHSKADPTPSEGVRCLNIDWFEY